MFSMAMWMAALVAPVQILAGDQHGLNTLEHQPAKVMAMEGHFQSHADGAPLILFGWPDQKEARVEAAIEIPKASSLILKHDLDAPLAGLDTVPRDEWPNVAIVFWAFRTMVGIGFLMLGLGLFSLLARMRGKLYAWPLLHRLALVMGPSGFVAVIAGWVTTEAGRQPWTVYGVLRTSDSVSPLAAPAVGASLIAFVIVYFTVFISGAIYILKMMNEPASGQGPDTAPIRTAGIVPGSRNHGRRRAQLMDLTVIWAGIIAFAVMAYVVMDGFDLGIGILFPRLASGNERDTAMNSIAPVWDGNETWLVLGGGGLLAAFPLAYSIVLPALYAPLIAMLLGLVLRGVAFEFRGRDANHRAAWDLVFTAGSLTATIAQGITLGALLQGITVEGRSYAGGWWDWLTPFSLLTALSLCVGYALLGACWLAMKSEGTLQAKAFRFARMFVVALVVAIGLVSAATPLLEGQYYQRWLDWPGLAVAIPMPLLVLGAGLMLWRSLVREQERAPFVWALSLFGLSFVGLAISIWPDVIPGRVTIWQAAAPEKSQSFMLVGAVVLVPMILAYTSWAYWVFRGKVGPHGYH